MKKDKLLLVLLLTLVYAVSSAGTWKLHNYYMDSKIQNIYDTGNKVYYVNGNALYQFDKATHATLALNNQNVLSDNKVKQIYYDHENKLLFVAYVNSNIDVIDEQGVVRNVSGIKSAVTRVFNYTVTKGVLTDYTGKDINDITFANGLAYVAIGYGYVTIDESTLAVIEDKVLGQKITINSVAVIGDMQLILSNGYCYYGPVGTDEPVRQFPKYAGTFTGGRIFPISDRSAFVLGTSALYRFDFNAGTPTVKTLVNTPPSNVQKTSSGYIANFAGKSYYYTIDPTGGTATKVSLTSKGFASCDPAGDGTVWISDKDGLHIKDNATVYALNAMTTDEPYWLKYNAEMDKLFVGVSAPNQITVTDYTKVSSIVNTYDGKQWEDATAYSVPGGGWEFVFNPLDRTSYMRASWMNGLYKVKDKKVKTNYTSSNSLVGTYKAHPAFDNYGNLWVASSFGNAACPVAVLPKDKVAKNSVTKADWFQPSGLLNLNTKTMQRSRFLVAKKNNAKIYSDCDFQSTKLRGSFLCWDNDNEDPTVDNYKFVSIAKFSDQDNKHVDWSYLAHLEEDKDGLIWAGHTLGLFVFDPVCVFDEHPKAVRPIVTKSEDNSDKGLLCDGYTVFDIGVDRDNNKWLATNNGVYFVSPDGTEVFKHFTTYNSDVPSNMVYSVECDTVHDRVYIYSDNGLAEYVANGTTAALNFDNMYVYPNPVEPDYTGMIKIDNLMEDTYVIVTNGNGQTVAQMGPVMGRALWDGCGDDGDRVPMGLYNIYVSQGHQPVVVGTPRATVLILK